jgi:lipopolysaccharide export system protein LptA
MLSLGACLLMCALALPADARRSRAADKDTTKAGAKPAKRSPDLTLRNANSSQGTLVNGQLVWTLTGNVIFDYDDLTIRADSARWWRGEGNVRMMANVRAVRDSSVLTCDQMSFSKTRKVVESTGRVDYRNRRDNIRLTGQRGDYDLDHNRLTLTGQPRFFRYDTTAAETLTIAGQEMVYEDSLGKATVLRNVTIDRARLATTCERAYYYSKTGRAELRGRPHVTYEDHTLDGDSLDLLLEGDTLRGVSVWGHAHALYRQPDTTDTNLTNVWSDSMYLAMTRSGELDSAWAWRNVLSTYELAESDSANRVSGKAMVLALEHDGGLRSATVWGNARSVYYVRDKGGSGRNDASGDSIRVMFQDGKASQLVLRGSVRGSYAPKKR